MKTLSACTLALATLAPLALQAEEDRLVTQREAIEERFGATLDWHRNEERKSSKVTYGHPFDGHNPGSWPEMIDWMAVPIQKLEHAFSEPLGRLNLEMRSMARGVGGVGG